MKDMFDQNIRSLAAVPGGSKWIVDDDQNAARNEEAITGPKASVRRICGGTICSLGGVHKFLLMGRAAGNPQRAGANPPGMPGFVYGGRLNI